jgi:hypothetical protein
LPLPRAPLRRARLPPGRSAHVVRNHPPACNPSKWW